MNRTLIARRQATLRAAAPLVTTLPVDLDPQTASLTLRIPRPTAANPFAWGSIGRLKVRICVDFDGEVYTCEGGTRGGVLVDNRAGREGAEIPEYSLTWDLPSGFFQKGNEPREQWANFKTKRWGELAKSSYRAWVEIERRAGAAPIEYELIANEEPAPEQDYHSSVAYQNASSAYEAGGGDMALSVSFTAGDAGSDRVAFVFGATSRDTRPTAAAVTYNGSISSDLGDVTNTYWRGAGGLAWDSLIGTGAKTVAFSASGGSGAIYDSFLNVISVTGAHQTTHGTVGTSGADSGTALSITVPGTPASDSLIVDGWAYVLESSTTIATAGANQTPRITGGAGTRAQQQVGSTQSGADGAVMSWTKATSNYEYVGMAIELKAAGGGGGDPEGRLKGGKLIRGGLLRGGVLAA